MKIDPTTIRDIFDYRDGALIWKINTGKKRLIGSVAGRLHDPRGYRRVGVRKRDYYLHHLVWAWHHGVWPEGRLDHASGDPSDNRIENLRPATQSQNLANSRRQQRAVYLKGTHPVRGASTWRAQITVNYQTINLGNHPTEHAAHEAYMSAARRFFGEFARAA